MRRSPARHRAYTTGDVVIVSNHAHQYRGLILEINSTEFVARVLYPGTFEPRTDSENRYVTHYGNNATIIELIREA